MRRQHTKEDIKFLKKFGKNFRNLREKAGLSQTQLEADANISKNQVGRIERGEISTTITNLKSLSKALDIDIRRFFDLPE